MAFLRLFEGKALAEALTEAGYPVLPRTVQRWKSGQTKPRPQDLAAIERVLHMTKEPRPEWAEALDAKVTATQATVERIAELLGVLAAAGSLPIPQPDADPPDGPARTQPANRPGPR